MSLASKVPGSPKNQLLQCCDKWVINSPLVYIRSSLAEVTVGPVNDVFIMYRHNVYTGYTHTSL